MMSLPKWLFKEICLHPRTIMRRREGHMGLECTCCFHWLPILPQEQREVLLTKP